MADFIETIKNRYRGGRDRLFILHGNTADLFPITSAEGASELLSLPDYFYRRLSAGGDNSRIWLHHCLGHPTRSIGDDKTSGFLRLDRLVKDISGKIQNPVGPPINFFGPLDQLCFRREKLADGKTEGALLPLRVIVTDAHLVIPEAQTVFMRPEDRSLLVLLKRFASEPLYDDTDMMLILITDALSGIHHELRECAVTIEIPRPNQSIGDHFEQAVADKNIIEPNDLPRLKELVVGLTVRQIQNLVAEHIVTKQPLTPAIISGRRRELTTRDYGDNVEYSNPTYTLDAVGSSKEAVAELRWIADALHRGDKDVPMGLVLVGQNGIGKTFIANGFLGTAGIPGMLFRSMLDPQLGIAERNCEKALTALRSGGQVAPLIDEADAQMGQRVGPNVHPVSKTIFSMQMQLMSDQAFRGRIFWVLMTCRPDKLAPDVLRPGRCERIIPLFPIASEEDALALVSAQVRLLTKNEGYQFAPDMLAETLSQAPDFLKLFMGRTGAQVENSILRRTRKALKGQPITQQAVADTITKDQKLRSEPMAYELQRLLAMITAVETDNTDLIPPFYQAQLEGPYGGIEKAKERAQKLRYLVDGV